MQNYYSKIIVVELTDDPNKCVPIYREDVFYEGTWELCIKAATKQAQNAGTTAQQTGAQYGQQGSQIAGTLTPALTQEATHPTGINPTDLNSMLVAGQQGAGGATSGVAGQAGLTAARTRNSGALSGVLDQAARTKQQANSGAALGVQGLNAQTKLKQQQEGLSGLEGLYGTNVNAGLKAQGLVPNDIDAWSRANSTGWYQNLLAGINSIGGAAAKVAGGGGGG